MTTDLILKELIETLLAGGRLDRDSWPEELGAPEHLGMQSSGGEVFMKPNLELLSASEISSALSHRAAGWLAELEVHRVIGSTNDRLVLLADRQSTDGRVCLAELQTKGRGRRGRTWFSPFGGNLALSMGVGVDRPLGELGGLSLVVGLGALDCLTTLGVGGLALKWPNDILLAGRKLGGILIELKSPPGQGPGRTDAVIGIGLNIDVPDEVRKFVDQSVTDLRGEGHRISRNLLAGRLISSVIDYVKEFDSVGFAPMREIFNEHHLLHQQTCEVLLGEKVVTGRVVGVTDFGELLLETASGSRAFGAGEVSLRPRG